MRAIQLCDAEPHVDTQAWCELPQFGKWRLQEPAHPDSEDRFFKVFPIQPSSWLHSKSEINEQFSKLAEKWRQDTAYLSSIHAIISHPAYLQIIAMGKDALPLIIKELRQRPGFWFWALEAITRQNPIDSGDAGNISKMTSAWLKWAKENWI